MPDAGACWSIATVAALVAATAGGWAAYRVRGSTAVPAALWALAAAAALAAETACRAAGGLGDPAAAAAARLAVGALGVCPAMSLLGAKRPQHGVWQFIVGALAVVIALPAASSTFVRPGTMPDVGVLWRCFLAGLVAVGWMNFAATRRAAAATLVAAGQFLLLRRFLPFAATSVTAGAPLDAAGACLVAAGAVVAAVQSVVERPRPSIAPEIDRPFVALRETLGAAWALRIVERFNAVAVERGWPCRLGFAGIEPAAAVASGAWRPAAARAFRALARRFVTADWLRRHGESDGTMAPTGDGR